jgi:glycosyltransferase involved in cell wall biosynthesis
MHRRKKVLFVVPYPLHRAPSQRFRVELFLSYLRSNNVEYKLAPFLDDATFSIFYKKGFALKKAKGVLKGLLKRFWLLLFEVSKHDFIFIHREASPIGPPFFEFIVGKILRKKIIYDFDDAIWIPDSRSQILNWFKACWKIKWICKWAYKVAAGNEYLAKFAGQHHTNVTLLPTAVDTADRYGSIVDQENSRPSIGWTGSHSTIKYLDAVLPVLQKLEKEYDFDFYVICNEASAFDLRSLRFVEWKESTEIEDLKKINIGIMPLEADPWSEGKCGFKIIQYLALGIPAVASPVGVNKKIVDEKNGFLCASDEDWYKALSSLLSNSLLREEMGKAGREKIVKEYSFQANAALFLALFK